METYEPILLLLLCYAVLHQSWLDAFGGPLTLQRLTRMSKGDNQLPPNAAIHPARTGLGDFRPLIHPPITPAHIPL